MMILCYFLDGLMPNFFFIAFIMKNSCFDENLKEDRKMAKIK